MGTCPFCELPPERIVAQNAHAVAIRDAFPVSPGHTLVIARRHIGSLFETTAEEKTALLELLAQIHAEGVGEFFCAAKISSDTVGKTRWLQHRHQRRRRCRPDHPAPAYSLDPALCR